MTIGTFLLTLVLAVATLWYAVSTHKLLRLSREQFEREWRPDLRIADVQSTSNPQNLMRETNLRIVNLARPAALIKELKIGTGGRSQKGVQPQDVETFSITHLVPGGQIYDAVMVHAELGEYRKTRNPVPFPGSKSPSQAIMNIALVYDCAGAENQTPWFDCTADFEDYVVTNVRRYG